MNSGHSWTYIHLFNRSPFSCSQGQKNVLNKCEFWWGNGEVDCQHWKTNIVKEINQLGQKKAFKVLETKLETPFEHILLGRQLIYPCYSRGDALALFAAERGQWKHQDGTSSADQCVMCVCELHINQQYSYVENNQQYNIFEKQEKWIRENRAMVNLYVLSIIKLWQVIKVLWYILWVTFNNSH